MSTPVASIIIATHNQWPYTIRCLLALVAETRDVPYEVIVVDNGSTDETVGALRQLDGVRVHVNDANLGFARACNQGAALARGRYLVFLNNDTEPRAGWLSRLVAAADGDPSIAIAGSQLLFPDGTIQSAGLFLAYGFPYPLTVVPRQYRKPAAEAPPSGDVRAVTGACLLARADAFAAAGGFDEGFTNGYEDVDLCLRLGEPAAVSRRIVYVAESVVTHHEAVSGGRFKNEAANLDRLQAKHIDRLDRIPFDYDYRRRAPVAPPGARRAPASVVVVAEDALATIVPCVENLVRTLRPDDELLLVDAGSRGASARILETLAARHAGPTRLLLAAGGGFAGAARVGIAATTAELVAVLGANVKVGAGWLDKLIAHLGRDPGVAALSPSWSGGRSGGDAAPLYAPPEAYPTPGASVLDKLVTPGPRAARVPSSGCLIARREVMRALAEDPAAPLGGPPTAIAQHLERGGRVLASAGDVFVRKLDQVGGDHHGPDRARYLELQSRPAAALPPVSVIIPIRDNLALTRACVDSVYRCSPPGIQLVLVDNGSSEDVAGFAAELQRARGNVVYRRNATNEGFAFACNQGLAAARGEILVLLNNDVEVTPGWLERPIALLELDPGIALCGPATNATSGPQLCGTATYRGVAEAGRFAERWARDHAGELAIVPRITGLCMVMRRGLIDRIGGFDTAFGFGNCEDDDFCVRVMRAGHKIAIAYDAFIHHHGSATFKALELDVRALCDENWEVFCAKWGHPVFDARARGLDALAALGRAAPFDAAADRIPVDYAEIFNRRAAPLALDTRKRVRVLCIPDWRAPAAWRPALERFFATFSAADPVALVVRVEPPTPANAERAAKAVSALLQERGIALPDAPDIVIEATPLPPARRGSLYTAASAYLACGGARDRFHRREAMACGLAIAELPQEQEKTQGQAQAQTQAQASARAPAVSVIVPTRNRPELLEVALRSVLAQTMQDFEIIVVNDAGVPITGVIQRLGAGGKIRCLENATNRGHGGARNAALRIARGRYVAYLDDDDSYHPDHLATLLGALAGGTYQVAYSDAARAHVAPAPAGGGSGMIVVARDVPYSTDFDPDAILLSNFIPILCVLHERACAGAEPLFDESLPVLEDWDVWIRLSRRHRFVHVPRVTCEFTVRRDGSSVTTERVGLFAATEQVIRQRYAREIAGSPRAREALRQSLAAGARR